MKIESIRGKKTCDNLESGVEYISQSPNENYTIHADSTHSSSDVDRLIDSIKRRVHNVMIRKGGLYCDSEIAGAGYLFSFGLNLSITDIIFFGILVERVGPSTMEKERTVLSRANNSRI